MYVYIYIYLHKILTVGEGGPSAMPPKPLGLSTLLNIKWAGCQCINWLSTTSTSKTLCWARACSYTNFSFILQYTCTHGTPLKWAYVQCACDLIVTLFFLPLVQIWTWNLNKSKKEAKPFAKNYEMQYHKVLEGWDAKSQSVQQLKQLSSVVQDWCSSLSSYIYTSYRGLRLFHVAFSCA